MIDPIISENVPLSKVLDALIIDNESPSVIINFLLCYSESIQEIFNDSCCVSRIYQLDFLLRCDPASEIRHLLKFLDASQPHQLKFGAFMTWQLMKSEDPRAKAITKMWMKKLMEYVSKSRERHPYRFGASKRVAELDVILIQACSQNRFVDQVAEFNADVLHMLFRHVDSSLFYHRLLQLDVFESLPSEQQQFAMINSIPTFDFNAECLMVHILDSHACIDAKLMALKNLKQLCYGFEEGSFVAKCLDCKSFSEFFLETTIAGKFELREVAVEFLRDHVRYMSILKKWVEHDREEFDTMLNASDLVDYLAANYERCDIV